MSKKYIVIVDDDPDLVETLSGEHPAFGREPIAVIELFDRRDRVG